VYVLIGAISTRMTGDTCSPGEKSTELIAGAVCSGEVSNGVCSLFASSALTALFRVSGGGGIASEQTELAETVGLGTDSPASSVGEQTVCVF